MAMTREDVLRELELLPVWQLRTPLENVVHKVALNHLQKPNQEKAEEIFQEPQNLPAEIVQKPEPSYYYYMAENNACVFICAHDDTPRARMDTGLQSILFDNICIAMQIKAKKIPIDLAGCTAKVLIAMGEKTAQSLLNNADNIDDLRGKTHVLHNLPLIVTYSAAEMLEHLPIKAKTWQDLCLAQTLIQSLQTL